MNKALPGGGVAAVAVMRGYAATTAGAETSTADATADASPSGPPAGGGFGQTIAYDTPDGNDYGVDLLRLHLETDH